MTPRLSDERRLALLDAQARVEELVEGYLTANGLTGVAAGISGDFDQWVQSQVTRG